MSQTSGARGPAESGATPPAGGEDDPDRVVIRDKRRVDQPSAGGPSAGADAAGGSAPDLDAVSADPVLADLQHQLDERTADLQRVSAEFANYRKRMDRDRVTIAEAATAGVVAALLPVLDDIDRAREHGDLTGGLKSVADQLDGVLAKLGLEAFGAVGDPFDPTLHEAVTHGQSEDVEAPTCTQVMRRGYRLGERLLRPALVGVSDPA